jgi:hypothetical protein
MMHVGTDHNPPSLPTLVTRLGELGWFDGTAGPVMQQLIGDGSKVQGKMAQLSGEYKGPRIDLIWRNLDPAQVEAQAKQFVDDRVDVIVAFEDKSIRAAQDATAAATDRIPVVFLHPSDPVRDGLVTSLSNPGGNLTGVYGARDPIVKQVELYQQIMPSLKTLYAFVDPTDASTDALYAEATDAASQLGITLAKEQASDLAVQEVPKVEFALSLKRAQELGIQVPPDVVTLAEPLVYQ